MTTLEWIIYGSCGIAFLCILIDAINVLRFLKSKTMKYLTQLDEIDQWLADNFGIIPGACSSTENLRYNTAKMIAEVLWPKKDHIDNDSKKDSGDSIMSNDLEEAARHSEILAYPMPEDGDIEKVMKVQEARIFHEIGFIAGANWQREQDHYAC